MQDFVYKGLPAKKATGGTACIVKIVFRKGTPATPVGYDPKIMHKGHLVAAAFGGSNGVENVVPLYVKANTPTMNLDVEAEVRRAVRAGDRVLYRATAYYSDINDELPSLVFIKAWGMKTSFRCFAVIRNAKNSPRTGCV